MVKEYIFRRNKILKIKIAKDILMEDFINYNEYIFITKKKWRIKMPNKDGTGPNKEGPCTGRCCGNCVEKNENLSTRRPLGFRRGQGCRYASTV
jgi:hypothetical protein